MSLSLTAKHVIAIEYDRTLDEAVSFAAAEWRRYLGLILGADRSQIPGPRLTLGIVPEPDLGDEGFEIRISDQAAEIRGGGPAGALYGVYEFLRRYGGCQFSGLGPDGEYVPKRDRIEIPAGRLRQKPQLWYRGLQFSSPEDFELNLQRLDWMAKNGMNYVMMHPRADVPGFETTITRDPATGREIVEAKDDLFTDSFMRRYFFPEMRKRGLKLDMNHHNLFFWLPPERYFDQHPEWYALVDGKRIRQRWQLSLCTSNREAVQTVIANMKAWLRRTPEAKIVGLIPEDGIGMCQCETCRKMDLHPDDAFKPFKTHRSRDGINPSKSRRYALLLNEVACEIRKEFPKVLVGAAAYVDLQWPPSDVQLESNIVPWVAIYWRCAAHELALDACEMNRFFYHLLEEWKQAHRGPLILYEYYMGMNCQKGLPYPMAEVICREWPRLKRLGIGGATIQSRALDHNTYALNYLAFARSGWSDCVDYAQLLDDFLRGLFGAMAPAIKPIFEMFQRQLQHVEREGSTSPYLRPFPPAIGCFLPNSYNVAYLMEEKGADFLFAQVEQALQNATEERERRQLQHFRDVVGYWTLAAEMVKTGFTIQNLERQGERAQTAAAAAEAVKKFEPAVRRLEVLPPAGWIRGVDLWRNPNQIGIEWFRQKAARNS